MDFLELNSGCKVLLDDLCKFICGYGIYFEIIFKLDNEIIFIDNNVFLFFCVLFEIFKVFEEFKKIYLCKDQDDEIKYLLKFLGGVKIGKSFIVGDFIIGVQGGYIGEDVCVELEVLVLCSFLSVLEFCFNCQIYFEGYNIISFGGGLKIKSFVVNSDGSYIVIFDLEDGVLLGQKLDDIFLGFWYDKSVIIGDFIGFRKIQYCIIFVDYDENIFVMVLCFGYEFVFYNEMCFGQMGNFIDKECQIYIIIDVCDGNCCIIFVDNVNIWDLELVQMKSWFGKKKGMIINGINCDRFLVVLQDIIMMGLIF